MKKETIIDIPASITPQKLTVAAEWSCVDAPDPEIKITSTLTGGTPVPPPPVPVPDPVPTPAPGTRKNNIIAVDFSKGALPSTAVLNMQPASRFAIKQLSGKSYAEVTTAKTDDPIGGSNRSEFNQPTKTAEVFKDGLERWYGIRYNLPNSFVTDVSPELLYQQHEYSGTASPHFALWTKGGHWYTAINGQQDFDLGAYEFNKDTDFVFHHIWSTGAKGLVEVYKNGVKVKTYTGPNMPTDSRIPYLKAGIYKWDWVKNPGRSQTLSRTIYIGAIYTGNEKATYDDVKP